MNNAKASALISIYAGQVLSFKPVNQAEDFLFVSQSAFFATGKAAKGGVPICWPWFGAAPERESSPGLKRPAHGFVRTSFWSLATADVLANGDVKIRLEFNDTQSTRDIWPYSFQLILEILVADSLTLQLVTRNTGEQPFTITEAFHAYLHVGDAGQVEVFGLEDAQYLDKNAGFAQARQSGTIKLIEATDRIYSATANNLLLVDPLFQRKIKISSSGNQHVVVWNPWVEAATAMKDLDNDDYKRFICLEIANAGKRGVEVLPDSESILSASYSIA